MKKLVGGVVLLLVVAAVVLWVLTAPKRVSADALPPRTANLANGETLFSIGGCASCHAASKDERTKLGGGVKLTTPFGTFYGPNISPDPTDGIGRWSEADFVSAMHDGTAPDGSHLYPAFPYPSYQRMTIDDVRDLFAYLKTLPPVAGKAPPHELPFPYDVRRAVGFWKLLYLDGEVFRPDPQQSEEWNRGAYLVSGPGHCGECHTPRDALGGKKESMRLAGGPDPEGKGWVPNITQKGLKDWSADDIAYLLETGMTPGFDTVGGSMADVIRNTKQLSAEDRRAIAVYLKSLPPVDGPTKPARPAEAAKS